ncbi:aminoacyl-tRNA hydrolase [Candidatus Gottesmanbacteria bacterium RIFCSPLOWO2_01_FULL_39_12b]|uniref:Peptidyl-tRNA hydrolase n=1 Tax=Candidatus Gottesmanbacteria bacterium RIFCSPLOWO2_01_FULL_39_12b TaxID=1798388 RepID=A0A1F6ANH7_9BACT|nr:MAG: aminoacyl-tRNA hydrolase [Candidatus Gottesmanbacteria bacterium RIFCSPLOWO2_01_FULL_39_12b]
MKLIVGLGNPDEKYKYTRHNIGFMVIEKLAKDLLPVGKSETGWSGEKKYTAEICKVGDKLVLVKPHTYMNRSGIAVLSILNFYKISINDLWVIHDDIDLPLGKIRIRRGGSSAGHNGVDSIIKNLHTDNFVRFRLGVGRGKLNIQHSGDYNLHRREIEKFVLSPFKDNEAGEVKKIIKRNVEALEIAINKGIASAMNRFN